MHEPIGLSRFHTLLHPYTASLVTAVDRHGNPNIIAIAWLIPLSVTPPLVGMSIGATRYTYELIHGTGEFVVNVAPWEIAEQVLFCGRRSGRVVAKFPASGLTPAPAQEVQPPLIEECLVHLECRVVREVGFGDHTLIVGEVVAASAMPGAVNAEGLYDLSRVRPLLHLGRNRFTTTLDTSVEPPLPD